MSQRIHASDVANAKTAKQKAKLWKIYLSQQTYSSGRHYRTLAMHISAQVPLSDSDVADILAHLFKGCRELTKQRAELVLRNNVGNSGLRSGWIAERVMWDEGLGWGYTAGQDYDSEIRGVRKFIVGGLV